MKRLSVFCKAHWFEIAIVAIFILGVILRFARYQQRWGLAYDQAHDAIIARYALTHFKLPLLGPFSSAGPFQTSGMWYWFIMLGTLLFPFFVDGPWVFLTILQSIFVIAMIYFGKELINKKFGLLLGLFTAISTSQITQATNLTNQAPLAFTSLGALWMSVRYLREKKKRYLFFMALFVGLGAAIHLQGGAMIALVVLTLLVTKTFDLRSLSLCFFGLILSWLPVFFIDVTHHFFNTKGMLQYYLHDQYRVSLDSLGRNWKVYTFKFWPTSWAQIIGGEKILGYILFFGFFVTLFIDTIKRRMSKEWVVIIASFLIMFAVLRYLRTPLFDSYLMFLNPFVLLFSAWFVYWLIKTQKIAGILILISILISSMLLDIQNISQSTNDTAIRANFWSMMIKAAYPMQKKFSMYDYGYATSWLSLPLTLYMQNQDKITENGYKIGFGMAGREDPANEHSFPIIPGNKMGFVLVDVEASSSGQLSSHHWVKINPENVYHSTEAWYNDKNL